MRLFADASSRGVRATRVRRGSSMDLKAIRSPHRVAIALACEILTEPLVALQAATSALDDRTG
jgi:hypothetical protein